VGFYLTFRIALELDRWLRLTNRRMSGRLLGARRNARFLRIRTLEKRLG
jgi:hypothetical protein